MRRSAIAMTTALLLASVAPSVASQPADTGGATVHPDLWPAAKSPAAITDPATEKRIDALIAKMTVEQKVGQLVQGDISTITPKDLETYPLGSILAGGNSGPNGNERSSAADWAKLVAPPQPFHVLPYAYAVRQGDPQWLARLDEFVAAIKRDGRLKDAAARYGLSRILVD